MFPADTLALTAPHSLHLWSPSLLPHYLLSQAKQPQGLIHCLLYIFIASLAGDCVRFIMFRWNLITRHCFPAGAVLSCPVCPVLCFLPLTELCFPGYFRQTVFVLFSTVWVLPFDNAPSRYSCISKQWKQMPSFTWRVCVEADQPPALWVAFMSTSDSEVSRSAAFHWSSPHTLCADLKVGFWCETGNTDTTCCFPKTVSGRLNFLKYQ